MEIIVKRIAYRSENFMRINKISYDLKKFSQNKKIEWENFFFDLICSIIKIIEINCKGKKKKFII